MIMLDVSKSMLVQDVWGKARIDVAKDMLTRLMHTIPQTSRGIGIFAGEAQWVIPLTSDTDLVQTFLGGLDYKNLSKQWSNLGEALNVAVQRFWNDKDNKNTILLISDWGEAIPSISDATTKAIKEQEIDLLLLGIWSKDWWPIPEWVDVFWNTIAKQWQWNTVISKLESQWLESLAQQYAWNYISYTSSSTQKIARLLSNNSLVVSRFSFTLLAFCTLLAISLTLLLVCNEFFSIISDSFIQNIKQKVHHLLLTHSNGS